MVFFSTSLTALKSTTQREILAKQLSQHLLTFLNTHCNDSAFADHSFFLVEKMQVKQGVSFSKKGGLYLIWHALLPKFYLGQTVSFSRRKADHLKNLKNFQPSLVKAKRFKLNAKMRHDIESYQLQVEAFKFYPLLVVEDYQLKHRALVAALEVLILQFFFQISPHVLWNHVAQDLLSDGKSIRAKGATSGGEKAKKVTNGTQSWDSISHAAKSLKVDRQTIRNRLVKHPHWKLVTEDLGER